MTTTNRDVEASETTWVYNAHNNDLGDWCPYSGQPFDGAWDAPEADPDVQGCPQNCRSSWLDAADAPAPAWPTVLAPTTTDPLHGAPAVGR